MRAKQRRHTISSLVGLLAVAAFIVACGPDNADEVLQLVPTVSRDLAENLDAGDDRELAEFGRTFGFHNLSFAYWEMINAYNVASDAEAARVDGIVGPMLARMPAAFSTYPSAGHVRDLAAKWNSMTIAQRRDTARKRVQIVKFENRDDPDAQERMLLELIDLWRKEPSPFLDSSVAYAAYYDLLTRLGRDNEAVALLPRAIDELLSIDLHGSACVLIGIQMSSAVADDDRAVLDIFDRGVRIARHCRPDQEARLLGMVGRYYARGGRFTMAHESWDAALELSARPGGQGNEIRYFYDLVAMHASLGCWAVVATELQQQGVLERRARKYLRADVDIWLRRIGGIRMRYHAGIGDLEQARRDFVALREAMKDSPVGDVELLMLNWSNILIAVGRYDEARPVVAEGIGRCSAARLSELPVFFLNLARIEYGVGHNDSCRVALDRFERHKSIGGVRPSHLIAHDVLRARLALAKHDAAAYARWVERAAMRAKEVLETTEATPQGYLGTGVTDLRGFLRGRVADDPDAAFALELNWRRSSESLGGRQVAGGRHPFSACIDIAGAGGTGAWRTQLARHLDRLRRLGAVHCVFAVGENSVSRWTARDGVITFNEIDVSPAQLGEMVMQARLELVESRESRPALEKLSVILLPPNVGNEADGARPLVLITPDGPLSDLPFEALSVAGSMVEPLISRADVAYVRGMPESALPSVARPGLVISDPLAAPALIRRHPALRRALDHGREEAAHLVHVDSSARLFEGEAATEAAVLKHWSDAGYIYFATHVLRDPELPYLSFIPMSPDPGNERHETYAIDISDIRAADLSHCELVVLSGCSSGSGYQDRRARGPALADAFLDARCGAVVETFWDVEDEAAATFMRDFIDSWAGEGVSPLRALCDVRRRWLKAGAEPVVWAGYTISLNRL